MNKMNPKDKPEKETDFEEEFTEFLSKRRILIADSQAASRVGLSRALIAMGARANLVVTVDSYEVAVEFIGIHKPHLLITDYDFGKNCGLDLLPKFRELRPNQSESFFALVTSNTSQSAVADAAEKDIDLYILKPYNIDLFKGALMAAIQEKMEPSEYTKAIAEGRHLLSSSKLQEAIQVFESAMQLSSKPSLAYFYHGQAHTLSRSIQNAQKSFIRGLEYNILHYKCLTGLYDALMEQGKLPQAYNVLKRITRYFPANATRLSQVLRLAVMNGHYEDIEDYYDQFLRVERKSPELIKHICAAIIVSGKYLLQKGETKRGIKLYQAAAVTAGSMTNFLSEIVLSFVEFELYEEADQTLKRYPIEMQASKEYAALDLLITSKMSSLSLTVSKGRQLIRKRLYDPLIFKVLIECSVRAGLHHSAEALADRAGSIWPDRKPEFLRLAAGKFPQSAEDREVAFQADFEELKRKVLAVK